MQLIESWMGNGNKVGFMPNKPILFTIPQQYREKNMPWLGWGAIPVPISKETSSSSNLLPISSACWMSIVRSVSCATFVGTKCATNKHRRPDRQQRDRRRKQNRKPVGKEPEISQPALRSLQRARVLPCSFLIYCNFYIIYIPNKGERLKFLETSNWKTISRRDGRKYRYIEGRYTHR